MTAALPLTEKEKQALRLIVRGHDAKSCARELNLSVHTINDRLRDARRKLGVSSSREAARLLLAEEGFPQKPVPDTIGKAAAPPAGQQAGAPATRRGIARRLAGSLAGVAAVILTLSLLALVPQSAPDAVVPAAAAERHPAETAAERFLGLIDRGRWEESWRATTPEFRRLNSVAAWTAASERARTPLGAVRSRVLLSREDVPAGGPAGTELVKFRTSFAGRADATEKVALAHEGGEWRVVGIYIE